MSFREMKRFETMRAEMQPDTYGGESCEEIIPQWLTYGEGDKDAGEQSEPLELDARQFPPGTVVSIQEPTCPNCEETREPEFDGQTMTGFARKCHCGFDWDEWTREIYG